MEIFMLVREIVHTYKPLIDFAYSIFNKQIQFVDDLDQVHTWN